MKRRPGNALTKADIKALCNWMLKHAPEIHTKFSNSNIKRLCQKVNASAIVHSDTLGGSRLKLRTICLLLNLLGIQLRDGNVKIPAVVVRAGIGPDGGVKKLGPNDRSTNERLYAQWVEDFLADRQIPSTTIPQTHQPPSPDPHPQAPASRLRELLNQLNQPQPPKAIPTTNIPFPREVPASPVRIAFKDLADELQVAIGTMNTVGNDNSKVIEKLLEKSISQASEITQLQLDVRDTQDQLIKALQVIQTLDNRVRTLEELIDVVTRPSVAATSVVGGGETDYARMNKSANDLFPQQ